MASTVLVARRKKWSKCERSDHAGRVCSRSLRTVFEKSAVGSPLSGSRVGTIHRCDEVVPRNWTLPIRKICVPLRKRSSQNAGTPSISMLHRNRRRTLSTVMSSNHEATVSKVAVEIIVGPGASRSSVIPQFVDSSMSCIVGSIC